MTEAGHFERTARLPPVFVIGDERHAERQGEFKTFDEAVSELRRRSELPWDDQPNVAPCMSWRTCGRSYEVIEFDDSRRPWTELRRVPVLDVSASGVTWH